LLKVKKYRFVISKQKPLPTRIDRGLTDEKNIFFRAGKQPTSIY